MGIPSDYDQIPKVLAQEGIALPKDLAEAISTAVVPTSDFPVIGPVDRFLSDFNEEHLGGFGGNKYTIDNNEIEKLKQAAETAFADATELGAADADAAGESVAKAFEALKPYAEGDQDKVVPGLDEIIARGRQLEEEAIFLGIKDYLAGLPVALEGMAAVQGGMGGFVLDGIVGGYADTLRIGADQLAEICGTAMTAIGAAKGREEIVAWPMIELLEGLKAHTAESAVLNNTLAALKLKAGMAQAWKTGTTPAMETMYGVPRVEISIPESGQIKITVTTRDKNWWNGSGHGATLGPEDDGWALAKKENLTVYVIGGITQNVVKGIPELSGRPVVVEAWVYSTDWSREI